MKKHYTRWLYTIAVLLIIIPFLGFPQGFKTALFVILGIVLGGLTFLLSRSLESTQLGAPTSYVEHDPEREVVQREENKQSEQEQS